MLKIMVTVGFLQFLMMLVLAARTKALAVLLGPELYGTMGALDRLIAVFAQTVSISLPFVAVRYLSPLWNSDRVAYVQLFRRMRNLLLLLLASGTVVGISLSVLNPGLFGKAGTLNHAALMAAMLTIGVASLAPFLQNVIASAFSPYRSMLFSLGHAIVFSIAGVVGVLLLGLEGLYLVYAIVGIIFAGGAMLIFSQKAEAGLALDAVKLRSTIALPRQVWRAIFLFLLPAVVSPVAALFAYNILLVDWGERTAGWMGAAVGIGLAVRGVMGAAHRALLIPEVNRDGSFEDRLIWANNFLKTFLLLTGVLVPLALVNSHVLVRLLYSGDFLAGARFVPLFVGAEILILVVGIYQALVVAMDRIGVHVFNNTVAQLLMMAVAYAAIPKFGVLGFALAFASAPSYMLVATIVVLAHHYRFRVPGRVVGLLCYNIVALTTAGWLGNEYPALTVEIAIYKVGFLVVAAAGIGMFLDSDDWAKLRRLLRTDDKDSLRG